MPGTNQSLNLGFGRASDVRFNKTKMMNVMMFFARELRAATDFRCACRSNLDFISSSHERSPAWTSEHRRRLGVAGFRSREL